MYAALPPVFLWRGPIFFTLARALAECQTLRWRVVAHSGSRSLHATEAFAASRRFVAVNAGSVM